MHLGSRAFTTYQPIIPTSATATIASAILTRFPMAGL
jgi:hypothetical protein